MGLEEKRNNKKDNKLDSKSNGRPVNFSLGDGNDLSIDLPTSIPGEEDLDTKEYDKDDIENITDDLTSKTKELQGLLKEMGVDEIEQFLKDNE